MLDQRRAIGVLELEDIAGDLNEVRVELALVPLGEDVSDLIGRQSKGVLQDLVGLADHLHITILDSVVDHLDVVTSSSLTDPVAARLAIYLGSDSLEDRLHMGPYKLSKKKAK